jgi:hypothetical protein
MLLPTMLHILRAMLPMPRARFCGGGRRSGGRGARHDYWGEQRAYRITRRSIRRDSGRCSARARVFRTAVTAAADISISGT